MTSRKLATLVFGLNDWPALRVCLARSFARALPTNIGLRCAQARPTLRVDQSHNCPQTDRPIFIIQIVYTKLRKCTTFLISTLLMKRRTYQGHSHSQTHQKWY